MSWCDVLSHLEQTHSRIRINNYPLDDSDLVLSYESEVNSNYVRPIYSNLVYNQARLNILNGWCGMYDLWQPTHPLYQQRFVERDKDILLSICYGDSPNWKNIYIQFKSGYGGCPTSSPYLHQMIHWIPNLLNKAPTIPYSIFRFVEAVHPYFKKRFTHLALMVVLLMEAMDLDTTWIVCTAVPYTKRTMIWNLNFIMSDFDFELRSFKYNAIPFRPVRSYTIHEPTEAARLLKEKKDKRMLAQFERAFQTWLHDDVIPTIEHL